MLRKKIILGMLVLGASIAGITQATIVNMEVGETYNYNGASITCDSNANCVSEFGDTILTGLIQGNSLQYQIIIRVGNDLAYFKDYGTYNFSRRIMEGCFTSLTNGVNANDYTLNTIPNCSKSNGNFNTRIENASTYGGELTSLTFNTFGNQGLICWNYNEELGSFCVQFANNLYNEAYDWGMVSPITVQKLIDIGMSDSPFNGGGEETPQMPEVTTGQICPLLKFEIDMYGRNYNTGLCYRPKYIGETESTNIFELFNSYQEFETYENLYYSSCVQPYTQEYCFNKFTGHEEQLAYITYINNKEGIDKMKIYQYCHLQLNFTEEQKRGSGTCQIPDEELYATGVNEQEATPNPLEQLTNALEDGVDIIVPSTGTVRDELLPDGVVSWKGLATNVDLVKSMVSLGSKIINIFITRQVQYQNGIIPYYISSLLILIFLYRLYKK